MSQLLSEACGIPAGARDDVVVGVGSTPTRAEISQAIDTRLRQVAAHAEGAGPKGVEARAIIVQAARRLMRGALDRERQASSAAAGGATASSGQRPGPGMPASASRDVAARRGAAIEVDETRVRELAAILRAAGGWNPRSRQRVMAWAKQRGLSSDQLRLAFTRVMGGRPRGTGRADPHLPQAAMEGLADSIDVVIDAPGTRAWSTPLLVVAGAALSLGAIAATWWALNRQPGATDGPGIDPSTQNTNGSLVEADKPTTVEPTSTATPSAAPGDTASAQPAKADPRTPPTPPVRATIKRDARLDGLIDAWGNAQRQTWKSEVARLSDVDLMARLERTHSLLDAATALASGAIDRAESTLESIPATPRPARAVAALPTTESPDLALGSSLNGAGRAASSRRKALEQFRATAGVRIGADDATALTATAFGDATREVRRLAQEIVLDRFAASPTLAVAMVESIPLATDGRDIEYRDFVAAYLGSPCDLPTNRWREWAARALAQRALGAIESPSATVDQLAETLRVAVASRAIALGAEPSLTAASRSAEEAGARLVLGVAAPLGREEQARLTSSLQDRLRAGDGPPQRFAAVQWTLVEATATALASRWPASRPAVSRILADAEALRESAPDVMQQLAGDAQALLQLEALRLELEWGAGGPA